MMYAYIMHYSNCIVKSYFTILQIYYITAIIREERRATPMRRAYLAGLNVQETLKQEKVLGVVGYYLLTEEALSFPKTEMKKQSHARQLWKNEQ